MEMDMENRGKQVTVIREGYRLSRVLLAFVGGAAAGAVAALLAAPRSGAETRERLRRMASGPREKLSQLPEALQAAKAAAEEAFHAALERSAPTPRH